LQYADLVGGLAQHVLELLKASQPELVVGGPVGLVGSLPCGGHRVVCVLNVGVGGCAHHRFVGGVDHVEPLARLGFPELAVDVEAAFVLD
jgi:hypothetical protein